MKKITDKKRNTLLILAIIGLVAGMGATGALVVGLNPTLDQKISGSLVAEVDTEAPMLIVSEPSSGELFSSDGNSVKFSADIGTLTAPGSVSYAITLTVNDVNGADGILVNMIGIEEPVRVLLGLDTGTHYRIGNGQWFIDAPEAVSSYVLTFDFYADRDPALSSTPIPMVFDIEIELVEE